MKFWSRTGRIAATIGASIALSAFTACSGEDGKDGVAGKDAEEVNVDSLANALREEITGTLWDTLYAEPYVDTVYNILFDNAFGEAWMDSIRQALLDSLKQADYDSLYSKLYDSVYNDIYSQTAIRTLSANVYTSKENINGAFASQYALMYDGYKNSDGVSRPQPASIKVKNACESLNFTEKELQQMTQEQYDYFLKQVPPCRWKKVMVKSWIEGFTDTAVTTHSVNPDTTVTFEFTYKFDHDALLAVSAPQKTNFQFRAYALENDHEILFFAGAEPTTVHPMQINNGELVGMNKKDLWDAVWVTPNMDSIPALLDDIAELLPNKVLKAYQKYSDDETMSQSTARVVSAVFDVLKSRKIKYVQNDGAGSKGQKINYPIEVLRSKQAVCNEFSFLVASVLEAIGLEVYIVTIPSHMFVGWAGEQGSTTLGFLETTQLNDDNATFETAYESGLKNFQEQQEAGNFENGKSTIISIVEAREYGIMPNDIP